LTNPTKEVHSPFNGKEVQRYGEIVRIGKIMGNYVWHRAHHRLGLLEGS
jgi:hypothetical protein